MPTTRTITQLGHPILRTPAARVAVPIPEAVLILADDMLATLRAANGVGIAAPQVGEGLGLFVVASRPNPRYPDAPSMEPTVMVNPSIVERSDDLADGWEGCLSIPGLRGLVPRPRRVRIRYATLLGEERDEEYADFVARVIQHEDDHLRGIVFLDRLRDARDVVTEAEYQARFAAAPVPLAGTGLGLDVRAGKLV